MSNSNVLGNKKKTENKIKLKTKNKIKLIQPPALFSPSVFGL